MVKRNFNGGGTAYRGSSSSSSSSSSGGGGGGGPHGRGQSSNQQADIINQARKDRRNQVQQAQQDERDWAGEFANVPSNVTYPKPADPYDWTKQNYGGVNPEYQAYLDRLTRHTEDGFSWYEEKGKTWKQRRDEQLISAFGGITGEWDPLQGLSDADRTALHDQGEFPWPPPGRSVTGGGGGGGGYSGWGSGGGGGGGGGGGYGYGMAGGQRPQQMANYYTPQANLQQSMVNVHTGRYKRGGIVSLLELR